MFRWLTESSVLMPQEMYDADRFAIRKTNIDRYRSRTEVQNEHIIAAYSWLRLPTITDNELGDWDRCNMLYRTVPIKRGVTEEEALQDAQEVVTRTKNNSRNLAILTFNTRTDAANSAKVQAWLDEDPEYTKLDVETMLISAPTHKIRIYKNVTENQVLYVILNNLDTPTVVFKVATAIMLDRNNMGEFTRTLAESWLDGNADKIYIAVTNYYQEYKERKTNEEREAALKNMCKQMTQDKSNVFKERMDILQGEIDHLFDTIRDRNEKLNEVKGQYLMYTLYDENEKAEELRAFFDSIKDKITAITYTNENLYFVYRTALIYYEPEMLQRYFESTRDNCVTNSSPAIKQMLKDIFLDNKYTLLIETGAILDLHNNNVRYLGPSDIQRVSPLQGIPNPHHNHYNCWGDNKPNIVQALIDKDYITALLTTFAAMSGLNISDTAVFERFVCQDTQTYKNVPCLKNNETGEIITMDTYVRRFEDNASNETNE